MQKLWFPEKRSYHQVGDLWDLRPDGTGTVTFYDQYQTRQA